MQTLQPSRDLETFQFTLILSLYISSLLLRKAMQTLQSFWDLETFQFTLFLSLYIASLLLRMAMQTLQPSWDLETFQLTLPFPIYCLFTSEDGNAVIAILLGLRNFSIYSVPFPI